MPLFLLLFFGTLHLTWIALGLPPEEVVVPIARDFFERYGLITILIASFLEGLFVIGWYFPGTTVIVICLVVSVSSLSAFMGATIAAAFGLIAAYCVNYALGKFGWYRVLRSLGFEESIEWGKARLTKHGLSAIFLTYWQFTLASTVSTSAGVLNYPKWRFLGASIVSVAFWSLFWSAIIYLLGAAAMSIVGVRFIIAIAVVWILIAATIHFRNN